ncbi:MAG TPA: hypothetical protein VLR26_12695 [Frankiaceae bacterium]|nr:hypothetical protein [Frankiaceae bacterium]
MTTSTPTTTTAPTARPALPRWATIGAISGVATALCLTGVGAASASTSNHTIRITATQTSDTIVNGADVATDRDEQQGRTTGYDVSSCLVDVTTHLANCDVALARPNGVMYGHSTVDARTGIGHGRITGGLRSLSGARGTISVAPASAPNVSMITITYHV